MKYLTSSFAIALLTVFGSNTVLADDGYRDTRTRGDSVQKSRYRLSDEKRPVDNDYYGRGDSYQDEFDHHDNSLAISHGKKRYRNSRNHARYRTNRHHRNRSYDHHRYYDDERRYYRRSYRHERRHRRAVRRAYHRAHRHHHYSDYCPLAGTSYPYYDSYLSTWFLIPLHSY